MSTLNRFKSSLFSSVRSAIFLLKDFPNNIWVDWATLQSRAKVYNLNFEASDKVRLAQLEEFARKKHGNWQLNEDRVSDAWFLWVIINYFQNHGKLNRTGIHVQYDENSKHIKVEQLCQIMWEDICSSPKKWVRHSCKMPGCSEGYVTVDGNEYLKRSKCALPKQKVIKASPRSTGNLQVLPKLTRNRRKKTQNHPNFVTCI